MLKYVVSTLPYILYEQSTVGDIDYKELEHADTSTILNILTQHVVLLDDVMIAHYDNDEFITQIVAIIGLEEYNFQLETVIGNLCICSHKLNYTVSIINKLVSYTDITKLDIDMSDKPFLAHLLQLPINWFREDQDMSDDALTYLLTVYNPDTLHILLTHNMYNVNKEPLQGLLDLVIRDRHYLEHVDLTQFVSCCISQDCDMSKSIVITDLVSPVIGSIITYFIMGTLPVSRKLSLLDIDDRIWATTIGKEFFTAYVDPKMNKYIKHNIKYSYGYIHLSKLVK